MILAVSSMEELFVKVSEWIAKLDEVREDLDEQIFIYFVENAKAIDIGDIIKELYGERRRERYTRARTTRTRRTDRDKRTKQPARTSRTRTGLEAVTGEIKVVVDEIREPL